MIIARQREQQILRNALTNEYSQFIAIYGRRRVGKTFLIREAFNYSFTFQHAGLANTGMSDQLLAFGNSLRDAGLKDFKNPSCWIDAFELLKELIKLTPGKKKVVFMDELSWMDTQNSRLVPALENFWNGWASGRKDIVLIVCASSTSWMLNKVVHNKGGLYNRLSAKIHLQPFTLNECEQYMQSRNIVMNRHQILECYMIMGGIPYYWSFLQKGLGLSQNIDSIFFAPDAPLKDEFEYLYASLFNHPADYVAIVTALGSKRAGMTRDEIVDASKVANCGSLTAKLKELESCGFIRSYKEYGKKKKGTLYQLIDNYTLFYFKFICGQQADSHLWTDLFNSPQRNVWSGLAFERVCLQHAEQIKEALGIRGVRSEICSWWCRPDKERGIDGAQIDLLICRGDAVINLCEMKFSRAPYSIDSATDKSLRQKIHAFQTITSCRDAIHLTLITPYGINGNEYSNNVQNVVDSDDLFAAQLF